jgi:hypothetical protein
VRQANGTPLPNWIEFNAASGTFQGQPPPGFEGTITVQVVARDSNGNEAANLMRLRFDDKNDEREETDLPSPQGGMMAPEAESEVAVAQRGTDNLHRLAGKASLNEQFARYGRQAWEMEKSALMRTAELAAGKRTS